MRTLRIFFLFLLGGGLVFAVTWLWPQMRGRDGALYNGGGSAYSMAPVGDVAGLNSVGDLAANAPFVPLPFPPPEEEEFDLFHQMGEKRGFAAAFEFFVDGQGSELNRHLAENFLEPNLHPANMSYAGQASDWARVGVIRGMINCADLARNLPVDRTRRIQLEEAVLRSMLDDELTDSMIRAEVLMALDARRKRQLAEGLDSVEAGQLRERIPNQVIIAVNQSIEARRWNRIWSSSVLASLGGVLLATLGVFLEKTGSQILTVVSGKKESREAPQVQKTSPRATKSDKSARSRRP